MDLLEEAKQGNKKAYEELTAPLEIKLYKTARLYFKQEPEVLKAVKHTLRQLYKHIINVKTEDMLMAWAIRFLVKYSDTKITKYANTSSWKKMYDTETYRDEYMLYHKESMLERCVTAMKPEHRLISVLFYYDEMKPEHIAWALKKSTREVNAIINASRDELLELTINEGVSKYNDYV